MKTVAIIVLGLLGIVEFLLRCVVVSVPLFGLFIVCEMLDAKRNPLESIAWSLLRDVLADR